MKKRLFATTLALVLALSCMTGCGGKAPASSAAPSGGATGEPVVFKLSHTFMNGQPMHTALLEASQKIQERTNGQIMIEVYDNCQIAYGLDGVEQCRRGANFINVYDASCLADWVPDYNALLGPMLFNSPEEFSEIAKGEFAKSLNAKAEENGVKMLALDYCFGMRQLGTAKKPVKSLDDLKNLKLRIPKSQLWTDSFMALGANPVPMGWSEIYNAIQQGVVEGCESSVSDFESSQFGEILKYVTETNHFIGTSAVMISLEAFNKLTPEQQQIMQEEFTAGAIKNNEMSKEVEIAAKKTLQEQGVEFIQLSDKEIAKFKEASKSFYDKYQGLTPGVYDTITKELEAIRAK